MRETWFDKITKTWHLQAFLVVGAFLLGIQNTYAIFAAIFGFIAGYVTYHKLIT